MSELLRASIREEVLTYNNNAATMTRAYWSDLLQPGPWDEQHRRRAEASAGLAAMWWNMAEEAVADGIRRGLL